jgi:tetratricopeptide (TPR) repeat protein
MAKRNGYILRRRVGKNHQLLETVYSHRVVPVGNGLDLDHLLLVLAEAIPQFSTDTELVQMARTKARYLAETFPDAKQGTALSDDDLEDVAMILEDFLSSTKNMPPDMVAYVHTYIGLVRQYQERYSSAVVSLLKALWIRKASHEEADRLAVSCHRLGLVYGLAGDFEQATTLLERAIQYYDEAHIAKGHHFVTGARKALESFEHKRSTCSNRELIERHEGAGPSEPKLRRISQGDIELIAPELL